MIRPLSTALLLATLWMLAGCATRTPDPLAARQRAYERLASFIEPRMTRRQLYALLPPRRTPTFTVSDMPVGLFGLPGPVGYCFENHPLDDDFRLGTAYILARPGTHPPIPAKRSNGAALTAAAIDQLLYGHSISWKTHLSKQNPDDVIFLRPVVVRTPDGRKKQQ